MADSQESLDFIKKRRDGNDVSGSGLMHTVTAQETIEQMLQSRHERISIHDQRVDSLS